VTYFGVSYYIIATCVAIVFLIAARAIRMPLVSYASFTFLVAFVGHILPGYYIAMGKALPSIDRGFDLEVYWIYLAFTLALPAGLLMGHLLGANVGLNLRLRRNEHWRVWLVAAGTLIYGLLYIHWLGTVPLNDLLFGSHDLLAVVVRRVQITHQLGGMENLPVLFQYWRVVLQMFALILFIYFVQYLGRGTINRAVMVVMFALLTYAYVFTLEKAPYLYALTALYLLRAERTFRVRSALLFAGVGLLAVYVMYVSFMGSSTEVWYEPFAEIGSRISAQSASVYAQIEYVRDNGFIWLRGLDLQFARRFFDNDYIDLSVWAFRELSPEYVKLGVVGAAGGNAFAQLYFMFSWLALPFFFVAVVAYGFADRVVANTINSDLLDKRTTMIVRSFYIALIPFTALGFAGSVFTVFGVPTLLNSALILLIIFFAGYVKISSIQLILPRLSPSVA
jgi:hypothetical protein